MAAYRRINLWAGLLEATAADTVAVQTRWEERSGSLLNVMLYGKPGSLGAPAPPRRWPLTRMHEEEEDEEEEDEEEELKNDFEAGPPQLPALGLGVSRMAKSPR